MNEIAVAISGVSKSYRTTRALDNISLSIPTGIMACLVGPDGAGKTTLVKLLCGILEPDSGTIGILGLDTVRDFSRLKKHIGYLSQNFTLYGDLTVDENIEFFAEIHRVTGYKKRREELLEFTRLADFRKRLAERLSGGMKQKLALACTLIHSPDIIFLDEPTTGVDPVSRREFWIILADLLARGITIIMTTPYMDEAERSGLVGLLHSGKLLFADAPARIRWLVSGTIIEVVCDDVRRAGRIAQGLVKKGNVALFGDRLHIQSEWQCFDQGAIEKKLASQGIRVQSVRSVAPSLENVFISLIQKENSVS